MDLSITLIEELLLLKNAKTTLDINQQYQTLMEHRPKYFLKHTLNTFEMLLNYPWHILPLEISIGTQDIE